MSSNRRFAAQILETSAGGFGGLAASLLVERQPRIAERFAPDGFSAWKAQLGRWLLDLSAAVDADEPELFVTRMLSTRRTFGARGADVEDLRSALEALRDILGERLPDDSAALTVPVVERALEAVSQPGPGDEADSEPLGRAALAYLRTILEGRPRDAVDEALRAAGEDGSVERVYLDVLLPAQREAGRLWQAGELTIAEEHAVTATTQRAMTLLRERGRTSPSRGKTALLACVAGNIHDIGVRAIADFFEMAGWRTINLGADVPPEEVANGAQFFDADVVLLAATLDPHVKPLRRAIEQIRAQESGVKIIVGGAVFDTVPDLWRKVGADGHASRVEEAEPLGIRLTGS